MLITLQINTFLVFAIIGAVFAGIQAATASGGANNVFVHYMSDGYDSPEVSRTNLLVSKTWRNEQSVDMYD